MNKTHKPINNDESRGWWRWHFDCCNYLQLKPPTMVMLHCRLLIQPLSPPTDSPMAFLPYSSNYSSTAFIYCTSLWHPLLFLSWLRYLLSLQLILSFTQLSALTLQLLVKLLSSDLDSLHTNWHWQLTLQLIYKISHAKNLHFKMF